MTSYYLALAAVGTCLHIAILTVTGRMSRPWTPRRGTK